MKAGHRLNWIMAQSVGLRRIYWMIRLFLSLLRRIITVATTIHLRMATATVVAAMGMAMVMVVVAAEVATVVVEMEAVAVTKPHNPIRQEVYFIPDGIHAVPTFCFFETHATQKY